ncbi:hypothetical protein ACFQJC_13345 [Haloferax namakaokahaiae]|uniref:Secreted glycoprotein n=1 Tax=Haloferax namakaokahaiae TaxID=1748331 RepID=A0ABD5ZHH6_9EURY
MKTNAPGSRAQTNLAGLAIALVFLTAATVSGVVIADRALVGATGDSLEQQRAEQVATAFADDPSLTTPVGALDATTLNETNVSTLETSLPILRGLEFRIRVNGTVVAERGDVSGGTTLSRGVAVATPRIESETISLDSDDSASIPGRTGSVRLDVDPDPDTTVETIRINDRVELHRPTGIEGTHVVNVSTTAPPLVRAEVNGSTPTGTITVEATVYDVETTTMEVTVDADA